MTFSAAMPQHHVYAWNSLHSKSGEDIILRSSALPQDLRPTTSIVILSRRPDFVYNSSKPLCCEHHPRLVPPTNLSQIAMAANIDPRVIRMDPRMDPHNVTPSNWKRLVLPPDPVPGDDDDHEQLYFVNKHNPNGMFSCSVLLNRAAICTGAHTDMYVP